MSFSVLPPPQDKDNFSKMGVKIIESAKNLGLEVDAEGMLQAWASEAIKVLVETEGEDIVGMAFMSVGKRWVDSTTQASLLDFKDPSGKLLEFAITIAQAFNASGLFYEHPEPIMEDETKEEFRVIRLKLR